MTIKRTFLFEIIDRVANKTVIGPVERTYDLNDSVINVEKTVISKFKEEVQNRYSFMKTKDLYRYKYDCVEVTNLLTNK